MYYNKYWWKSDDYRYLQVCKMEFFFLDIKQVEEKQAQKALLLLLFWLNGRNSWWLKRYDYNKDLLKFNLAALINVRAYSVYTGMNIYPFIYIHIYTYICMCILSKKCTNSFISNELIHVFTFYMSYIFIHMVSWHKIYLNTLAYTL